MTPPVRAGSWGIRYSSRRSLIVYNGKEMKKRKSNQHAGSTKYLYLKGGRAWEKASDPWIRCAMHEHFAIDRHGTNDRHDGARRVAVNSVLLNCVAI